MKLLKLLKYSKKFINKYKIKKYYIFYIIIYHNLYMRNEYLLHFIYFNNYKSSI